MKIDFQNSIRRLSFLCCLTDIKIAWINSRQSEEIWSVSYVTCIDIVAQVSVTPWSVFLFLDVPTLKLKIIINILLTDQPEIILPTVLQQRIKLPSPKYRLFRFFQSIIFFISHNFQTPESMIFFWEKYYLKSNYLLISETKNDNVKGNMKHNKIKWVLISFCNMSTVIRNKELETWISLRVIFEIQDNSTT